MTPTGTAEGFEAGLVSRFLFGDPRTAFPYSRTVTVSDSASNSATALVEYGSAGKSFAMLTAGVSNSTSFKFVSPPVPLLSGLVVHSIPSPPTRDVWTGSNVTNPTWWDVANTVNWTGIALSNTPPGTFANGDSVLFDDTAFPASPVAVEVRTAVLHGNMSFANSGKDYIVSGAFGIGGTGALAKSGSGRVTLGSNNSYTGGTTLWGPGSLEILNAAALGSGTLNLKSTVTGPNTTLQIDGGVNLANAIVIDSTTGREGITTTTGSITLSGPITITGALGNGVILNIDLSSATGDGKTLVVGNTITATEGYTGGISLRGPAGNFGRIAGVVNAPLMTLEQRFGTEGSVDFGSFADNITEVTPALAAGLPTLSTGWSYRTFRAPGTLPTAPKAFLRAIISGTP